jgi:hypothetical protein
LLPPPAAGTSLPLPPLLRLLPPRGESAAHTSDLTSVRAFSSSREYGEATRLRSGRSSERERAPLLDESRFDIYDQGRARGRTGKAAARRSTRLVVLGASNNLKEPSHSLFFLLPSRQTTTSPAFFLLPPPPFPLRRRASDQRVVVLGAGTVVEAVHEEEGFDRKDRVEASTDFPPAFLALDLSLLRRQMSSVRPRSEGHGPVQTTSSTALFFCFFPSFIQLPPLLQPTPHLKHRKQPGATSLPSTKAMTGTVRLLLLTIGAKKGR